MRLVLVSTIHQRLVRFTLSQGTNGESNLSSIAIDTCRLLLRSKIVTSMFWAAMSLQWLTLSGWTQSQTMTTITGNLSRCGLKVLRMTLSTGSVHVPSHKQKFSSLGAKRMDILQLHPIYSTHNLIRSPRLGICPTKTHFTREHSFAKMVKCMPTATRMTLLTSTQSQTRRGQRRCLVTETCLELNRWLI